MVKLLKAIKSWFEDTDRAALDRFLSKSANRADLEERMRKWDHNRSNNFFV